MSSPEKIRVVQWATGAVGAAQLREVVDRPDLELVGLFVYDPAKVGVDAGTLVGRPPTGIAATNDKAAILALDADCVVYNALGLVQRRLGKTDEAEEQFAKAKIEGVKEKAEFLVSADWPVAWRMTSTIC
mgnify:CR=1 FL=1